MRVPLTGGAYAAQSLIASAQRAVNLYPELNPEGNEAPVTHYQTPGLTLFSASPDAGPIRCIYTASNGALFVVSGPNVYNVDASLNWNLLGTIQSAAGVVYICDNGSKAFLVDGSTLGYIIDLATVKLAQCTDPAFYGGTRVDFVDGYFVFTKPSSNQFYISLYGDTAFNSLDLAAKVGYSDNLVTSAVMHREIWLFGELTTEIWYNTGAADFTFGRMPGTFIEHGCAARNSVAKIDLQLFWLSKDLQGQGFVFKGANYQPQRISNHALEAEFATYARIDDAIGFTYQQNGHPFYVLTFPTANKTWAYDVSTQQWHQRAYLGADGGLNRHRANCHAVFQGKNLVGDWQNGNVYVLDPNAYTDNGQPIERIRSFPHMMSDGKRMMYRQFIADMEVGDGLPGDMRAPELRLRWSDTRGASWGNPITGSVGKAGEYLTSIQFQRLGYARDRVFELSWSDPIKTALNGAFIDVSAART